MPFRAGMLAALLVTLLVPASVPAEEPTSIPSDAAAAQTAKPSPTDLAPEEKGKPQPRFIAPEASLPDPDPELSPSCLKSLQQIQALDRAIPKSFQYLPRPVNEIAKDMAECEQLCRRFLDECPGQTAEQYVQRLLARMILGGIAHYRGDLEKRGMEGEDIAKQLRLRYSEARRFGEAALATCTEKTAEHLMSVLLLIDLVSQVGTSAEIRSLVDGFSAFYPHYPTLGEQYFKVAKGYINDQKYAEAHKYATRTLAENPNDRWYPIFNISLFDAQQGIGDLEGMEKLMLDIRSTYPVRMPEWRGLAVTQAKQWLDVSGFWLGFTRYAQGDPTGARTYFAENETHLAQKVALAKEKHRPVDPVLEIYLNFRTRDYLKVLDEFHGRAPEIDLDLGDFWVTDNQMTLREARGKVMFILFREPGNARSEAFYKDMDQFAREREKDGLVGATVSYLIGRELPGRNEKIFLAMQEEMAKLGISLPGGYDPDREGQKIFRAMHATVGPSATFVAFDRQGRFAWYLFDPRAMDRQLARKALDRLLKE